MKKLAIAVVMIAAVFVAPAHADDHDEEIDFLETVNSYLEVSERYVSLADRKEAAIFFAVEGIVEIHEDRGEQAAAIPMLTSILDQYPDNQTVRNVVRFKLRDLYRDTGQAEKALGELQQVIAENR